MLRDDRAGGEGRRQAARNVLGEVLEICSITPMTGFYRDGCCNTGREDMGSHTVCALMTAAFLKFSKSRGNDLSTPLLEFGFPGLKPGVRCSQHSSHPFTAGLPIPESRCPASRLPPRIRRRAMRAPPRSWPLSSVQPELAVDRADLGRLDQTRMRHGD